MKYSSIDNARKTGRAFSKRPGDIDLSRVLYHCFCLFYSKSYLSLSAEERILMPGPGSRSRYNHSDKTKVSVQVNQRYQKDGALLRGLGNKTKAPTKFTRDFLGLHVQRGFAHMYGNRFGLQVV